MPRILIADDELPIREWLEMCVEASGIEFTAVLHAQNGEEALTIIEDLSPEIVITDITMPRLNGIELIKKIRSFDKHTKIAILTCHNDFEFARSALKCGVSDYLLKNELCKDDVIQLLKKFVSEMSNDRRRQSDKDQIIRGHYLRSMIRDWQGQAITPQELSKYRVHIDDRPFVVVSFTYDEDAVRRMDVQGMDFIHNYVLFLYENTDIILIANLRDRGSGVDASRRTLLERIQGACDSEVNIGYSRIHTQSEEITIAIKEAIAMRDYLFFHPEDKEGTGLSMVMDDRSVKASILEKKQEVVDAYKIWGKEAASRLLIKLWECIDTSQIQDVSFIKRCFITIVENIDTMTEGDRKHYGLYDAIKASINIIELRAYMEQFIISLEDHHQYSKIVRQAINYVASNYHNSGISLGVVAGHVNLSEEYLSRLFKKETGSNFTEHLNDLRMKKAEKLIKTTDLNINEIASMVGIVNSSYFSNVFKKQFGLSPSSMRESV